ncbi:MAG: PH domain-containing protein [Candidatus Marsarchaeota archaeon]|nr:PH domain-containing protein [Candidatus Marsarchaeota archaeon]
MQARGRFENGVEIGGEGRTHLGVLKAKESLRKNNIPLHVHGFRCMNLLRHVLYRGEETLLEAKQHAFQSISPVRIVATDKRLIIVYPSFWGLWTGYDLISPTTYAILPYKYIIGVSMSRGKMLSSIKIHTSGSVDAGSQINVLGEVHGIKTQTAINMTRLLEEIIEYIEDTEANEATSKIHNSGKDVNLMHTSSSDPVAVDLIGARAILASTQKKFVWVGIEPISYVSRLLGTQTERVLLVNPTRINEYSREEAAELDGAVIVSYDGTLSKHMAIFIRYKFGIQSYVLDGGIDKIIEDSRAARDIYSNYR